MRLPSLVLPRLCISLTTVAILAGCVPSTNAPLEWLPNAEEAVRRPYGSWVEVRGRGGAFQETLLAEGELIAISSDTLYVAETDWDAVRLWTTYLVRGRSVAGVAPDLQMWADTVSCAVVAVPRSRIREATIRRYSGDEATTAANTLAAIGVLSAFSHGWFAVLTVPAWLGVVAGRDDQAVATVRFSNSPRSSTLFDDPTERNDEKHWGALRPWARFPQGLPPSVDRRTLRPYIGVLASATSG